MLTQYCMHIYTSGVIDLNGYHPAEVGVIMVRKSRATRRIAEVAKSDGGHLRFSLLRGLEA